VSAEQRENLEAVLRRSAFPVDSDVSEQRRLLRELASAPQLPADVSVIEAESGGVPTAEITIDGVESRDAVLYFDGGVYVIGNAFQALMRFSSRMPPPRERQGAGLCLPTL
jgi:epsilon-lactone hydrolase